MFVDCFRINREEIAWDIDTIYLSHDTRILNLRDFDHLEPKYVFLVSSRFTLWLNNEFACSET